MPEVCIVGQIAGASGFESWNVFSKWRFETGLATAGVLDHSKDESKDKPKPPGGNGGVSVSSAGNSGDGKWRVLAGEAIGQTWIAQRHKKEELAVWNHPIDITFACSTLSGWPKLVVEVFHTDEFDRVDFAGYGSVVVPVCAGRHWREIVVFRPSGTLMQQIAAATLGGAPQYAHPGVILSGDSRFGHHTVSAGNVYVEFNVVLKGFANNIHTTIGPTPLTASATGVHSPCGDCPPYTDGKHDNPAHANDKSKSNAGAGGSGASGSADRGSVPPLTAASIGSNERLLAARAATAAAMNAAWQAQHQPAYQSQPITATATPAVRLQPDGSVAARRPNDPQPQHPATAAATASAAAAAVSVPPPQPQAQPQSSQPPQQQPAMLAPPPASAAAPPATAITIRDDNKPRSGGFDLAQIAAAAAAPPVAAVRPTASGARTTPIAGPTPATVAAADAQKTAEPA